VEGFAMEEVSIVYGRTVYFTAKWYILWPFGTLCGHLVYFSRFGKNLAALIVTILVSR
jgi:hypothetical protein